mgnify:FL=1|tara:strand:+ start:98 stop:505 length:408 start_codon:yes stop_codon:yes gene_type:complete
MPACDECGQWEKPSLAVDAIVIDGDKILLIKRGKEPWKGMLAFPGGFVEQGEDPEVAVIRELKEECGLDGVVEKLVCVKGDPNRDPRGHVVSIAYLVTAQGMPLAGDDAADAAWYDLSEIKELAGDHMSMLENIQ